MIPTMGPYELKAEIFCFLQNAAKKNPDLRLHFSRLMLSQLEFIFYRDFTGGKEEIEQIYRIVLKENREGSILGLNKEGVES